MRVASIPIRVLSCLTLACLTAACTHDGAGDAVTNLESSVPSRGAIAEDQGRALASAAPLGRPRLLGLPTDAEPVGTTRTRDYPDGLRQDVALTGARVPSVSNGMTFVARRNATETLEERVPMAKPTEAAIRSEIGAAMPRVAMQVVERERSNDYGPYGLALGRVGADTRCLFMWQWIDGNRLPRDAGLAGPASVRVRLCRTGVTFDEMAAWTDHLVIGPSFGEAVAAAEVDDIDHAPRRGRSGRRRFAAHRHGGAIAQARRTSREHVSTQALAAPVDGPRYLAADAGTPVRSAAMLPVPPIPVTRFGGDLPPEAFAGPRSSPALPSQPRS